MVYCTFACSGSVGIYVVVHGGHFLDEFPPFSIVFSQVVTPWMNDMMWVCWFILSDKLFLSWLFRIHQWLNLMIILSLGYMDMLCNPVIETTLFCFCHHLQHFPVHTMGICFRDILATVHCYPSFISSLNNSIFQESYSLDYEPFLSITPPPPSAYLSFKFQGVFYLECDHRHAIIKFISWNHLNILQLNFYFIDKYIFFILMFRNIVWGDSLKSTNLIIYVLK